MKKILLLLILFSLILSFVYCQQIVSTQQSQEGTRVIFYVQHQSQQPTDYVQISIQIKSQQPSLDQAINQAAQIVQKVQTIVKNYCQQYAKGKKDCQQVVQTSQYQINPIYQLVRKVPTFVAFSVKHQTVAKIKQVKNIGKLADDILKSKVSKINSFQWKPIEQIDIQQQTVTQGMELVSNICERMGMKLDRIVQVSQVSQYQDQEQQSQQKQDDKQQQQQQQQEQDNKVTFKFQIICGQKKIKKKQKK